jgi:hypothetical protein
MLHALSLLSFCRSDEQAFKRTDTAQRRAETEKRAQERAEAEAQRLREQAASAWREERETKLNALHDLNLQVRKRESVCVQLAIQYIYSLPGCGEV